MNAIAIIREAQLDGVRLALSASGSIKATGDSAVVNRWVPTIREHRAEIIEVLQCASNDGSTLPVLSDQEEQHVLAWLKLIGETDPVTIGEVIDRCRSDACARRYFIDRAQADDVGVTGTVRHRGLPEAEVICRHGQTPASHAFCRRVTGG